jgi:hypothetical protein
MSTIATKDGTQIYHNDRGSSQPIISVMAGPFR